MKFSLYVNIHLNALCILKMTYLVPRQRTRQIVRISPSQHRLDYPSAFWTLMSWEWRKRYDSLTLIIAIYVIPEAHHLIILIDPLSPSSTLRWLPTEQQNDQIWYWRQFVITMLSFAVTKVWIQNIFHAIDGHRKPIIQRNITAPNFNHDNYYIVKRVSM